MAQVTPGGTPGCIPSTMHYTHPNACSLLVSFCFQTCRPILLLTCTFERPAVGLERFINSMFTKTQSTQLPLQLQPPPPLQLLPTLQQQLPRGPRLVSLSSRMHANPQWTCPCAWQWAWLPATLSSIVLQHQTHIMHYSFNIIASPLLSPAGPVGSGLQRILTAYV